MTAARASRYAETTHWIVAERSCAGPVRQAVEGDVDDRRVQDRHDRAEHDDDGDPLDVGLDHPHRGDVPGSA